MRVQARRSVELSLTLGAQDAVDLMELLAAARKAGVEPALAGFYMDLELAIRDGLTSEGVVVHSRGGPALQAAHAIASGWAQGQGRDITAAAMGKGKDTPDLPPDPKAKPVKVDSREAGNMEPRQGVKPVFT